MEIIKKHDFVEIEYVGKLKNIGQIFDLTDENLAKENNLYDEHRKYGPVIICIGEAFLIHGLDTQLEGKSLGKYKFEIKPEDGFGRKNPKLIQIVNLNVFLKQNINPFPGLQVNIDGLMGTIRSVSGGRCVVDFNHPLAGRELEYEVNIIRKIDSVEDKLKSLLNFKFYIDETNYELIKNEDSSIKIKFKMPDHIEANALKEIEKKIKELIPELKSIELVLEKTTTQE